MEIYCRVCGEPFDNDEFHDMAAEANDSRVTYGSLITDFTTRGCKALEPFSGPQRNCQPTGDGREALIGAVYDEIAVSGDMDDAAILFDDMGIH